MFSAILLGVLYLFFGAFEVVFENNHNFNLWQVVSLIAADGSLLINQDNAWVMARELYAFLQIVPCSWLYLKSMLTFRCAKRG